VDILAGGRICSGKRSALTETIERLHISRQQGNIRLRVLRNELHRQAKQGEIGGPPIPPIARPAPGFAISHNSGTYDAEGRLKTQSIKTKRDSGEVFTPISGQVIKGESALVDPDGRVLAKWVKTGAGGGGETIDALRTAFSEYQGAAPLIPVPSDCNLDHLTVYPLADLHIGMLAWGKESGEDYDVKIAVAQMTSAVTELVQQSRPTQKAVILILGDYFHSNDAKAVTPGSGHKLDVDGRWQQVFTAAAKLAVAMIDIVALKHAEVEVVVLPGNHDPDAAVCLAVALGMFFESNTRISIAQTPAIAWFLRFGCSLMGATHGHTMPFERMAAILAVDRPEDWGQTTYRTMFTGHIHQDRVRVINTVRVESFASPAAKDSWTAAAGYRSDRALHAVTFHRNRGEIGRHRVAISAI
jgi:hypothetical protein